MTMARPMPWAPPVTTATLPSGWEGRLVAVRNENTLGATGWCLEPHDLWVSKAIAGRPKDLLDLAELRRIQAGGVAE